MSTSTKKGNSLIEGSVQKHVIGLTWPMMFGILAVLSTSIVDTYFVGQLGTDQLAALSFTFPVVLGLSSIAIGLGVGTSSVIARTVGSDDREQTRRVATDALLLSLLLIIFFSIVGFFTVRPLFQLMGASGNVLNYIVSYMRIWFAGLPLLVIPMVSGSIIRALGDSFWPSLQMVASAIINIIFTPILIYGKWGFPELSFDGAAWGTCLAWFFTLIFAVYLVVFRENLINFKRVSIKHILESWRKVFVVAIPSALSQVVHPFSIGVITSMIATYGDDSVAGFGIGTRIESLCLIPLFALSAGIPPVAGQNWGAKKFARAKKAMTFGYTLSISWGLFASLIVFTMAPEIANLFSKNPVVVNSAATYIRTVVITIMGYGIVMCSSATFNAIGKPLVSFGYSILRSIILYIPLAFVATKITTEERGIFIAIAVSNIIAGIVAGSYSLYKLKCIREES